MCQSNLDTEYAERKSFTERKWSMHITGLLQPI